jgi:hypothetical protein
MTERERFDLAASLPDTYAMTASEEHARSLLERAHSRARS